MATKKQEKNVKKTENYFGKELPIDEDAEKFDLEKMRADKRNPIADVLHKFKYSFQGFAYCFKNETSFTFEALAIVGALIVGNIVKIEPHYWVFSLLSLFLIMEIEFLNTAIEAVVDMVTTKYHPLAKIAKDCGSAATCMATLIAVVVHLYIYGYVYLLPLILK